MASSASAGKRGPARPRKGAPAKVGAGKVGGGWLARWWRVMLLVGLATIGLPLGHAIFGEVVALLGGAVLLGFLLGRWTAQ